MDSNLFQTKACQLHCNLQCVLQHLNKNTISQCKYFFTPRSPAVSVTKLRSFELGDVNKLRYTYIQSYLCALPLNSHLSLRVNKVRRSSVISAYLYSHKNPDMYRVICSTGLMKEYRYALISKGNELSQHGRRGRENRKKAVMRQKRVSITPPQVRFQEQRTLVPVPPRRFDLENDLSPFRSRQGKYSHEPRA